MSDFNYFDNCVVGVDVGGTNTDAVVLHDRCVLGSAKAPTTADVTSGVKAAIKQAVQEANYKGRCTIARVNIGTTHFVNAVIQRRDLTKVAVVRLCGTASKALPPFIDFPEDLCQVIKGPIYLINGGFQFDGQPITSVDEVEISQCIDDIQAKGLTHVVVSGVFSPVNPQQEQLVGEIFKERYSEANVTFSHEVGQIGLLERENAAILNASLKPLCRRIMAALSVALQDLGLTCPYFLTQNDGTIISAKQTLEFPVHTFSSGPTNSMRGAALLSDVMDAIVIDIGGTSSDVGCLQRGFPREASSHVKVGGVRTRLRMPDVISIGLGGGSKIAIQRNIEGAITSCQVGPESVGYKLLEDAMVFGGSTLTSTDIAVAAGLVKLGDSERVKDVKPDQVRKAMEVMTEMIEDVIDQIKFTGEDLPIILVGGGSILINEEHVLLGASKVIKPPHYQVANAVGAALSQVGGVHDTIVNLATITREVAIEEAKKVAIDRAIKNGAEKSTVQVTEVEEVSLTYVSGCTRIKVKAVGDLAQTSSTMIAASDPAQASSEVKADGNPPQTSSEMMAAGDPAHTTSTVKAVGDPAQASSEVKADPDPPQTSSEITAAGDPAPTSSTDFTSTGMQKDDRKTSKRTPNVNKETGEWHLSEWDIECISVGAGILGCGGGGSPYIGKLHVKQLLKEGKKIRVIAPERLGTRKDLTGRVATVAFMGAPGVLTEKIMNGLETVNAIHCQQDLTKAGFIERAYQNKVADIQYWDGVTYIEDYQPLQDGTADTADIDNDKIVAVMSVEIGGMNALEPLAVGALLDIPVIDCDGMGRAFPELQMFLPSIYGKSLVPSCLVDDKGQRAVVLEAENAKKLEDHFRGVTISMGCSAAVSFHPLTKEEVLETCVLYSLSRAWHLGDAVLSAQSSPVAAITDQENGTVLITGKVSDVARANESGFDKGYIILEGIQEWSGSNLQVDFQNENLLATMKSNQKNEVVACVPDLICIVDSDTGQPIATDEVRYGLRVSVVVIPAAPLLTSSVALATIGPRAFGFDVDYISSGTYNKPLSIPLR